MVTLEAETDGVTLFFPEKLTTFFSHRPLQRDDLFSCRLLTPPTFRCRFSKFNHKFYFYSSVTPGGCHPGLFAPPPQWRHWLYNKQSVGCNAHTAALQNKKVRPKLGQTDLVFGLWSEFISMSVPVRLQVSVMICATLVNSQTHRQTHSFWPVILLVEPAELKTK